MRKIATLGLTAVFAVAILANPLLAGPGCTAGKKDPASCAKICTTKGLDKSEGASTDGKLIGAAHDCDYKGKCETISMNITGMTCTGCESSITTALMKQEGVIEVLSIDHKTGQAMVCFDPEKVESAKLASVVANKGYKASVIPATVTSESGEVKAKACGVSAKAEETKKQDY